MAQRDTQGGQFSGFERILYERANADDLDGFSPDVLNGIARSLWHLLAERQPGTPRIYVSNPVRDRDWFDSTNTIVQIICDDTPFIIDSVLGELNDMGFQIERILHPIVEVKRDGAGHRHDVRPRTFTETENQEAAARAEGYVRESIVYVEIDRQQDEEVHLKIKANLLAVLKDVAIVVADWASMRATLAETIEEVRSIPKTAAAPEERDEVLAFLEWLLDDHFALLGTRDYRVVGDVETGELVPQHDAGQGILRNPDTKILRREGEATSMTPEVRAFLQQPGISVVTKSNVRSRVHRRVHMDYIGIKRFNENGELVGERRIVGLFTSAAYNKSPLDIPVLRLKIGAVLHQARLPAGGHDARALLNILETYPRDELFQVTISELLDSAIGILRLQKRPHTKVLIRRDQFDRFVSVMVFVPRDKYDTKMRLFIGDLLADRFDGRVSAFRPTFSDGPLTRVHFIIGRNMGEPPQVEAHDIEFEIERAMRDWTDDLRAELHRQFGNAHGRELFTRYGKGFPFGYRDRYPCSEAAQDIKTIEELKAYPEVGLHSYRLASDVPITLRLKVYHWDTPIPLSDCLPVFESMGLRVIDEIPHTITAAPDGGKTQAGEKAAGRSIWIHNFFMTHRESVSIDIDAVKEEFEDAFRAVWFGDAENDGFNRLVVEQGMSWRDVVILRTCARYWRQGGLSYNQDYLEDALTSNSDIAKLLVELFKTRFDPALPYSVDERKEAQDKIVEKIHAALDDVSSLDFDRILRRIGNLILATQRTNFYQTDADGDPLAHLSLKLSTRELDEIPEPRPAAEIFIYSPRVEGVHLRGGKVARGGIRWSDRPEDFRTEVLGLVKAQQVKNAVIVPVGAKGGFVPKKIPVGAGRDEAVKEAIDCYKIFITALLDLTDNLTADGIEKPDHVITYDDDDPYLVVAADKGTATFSDIANDLAVEAGFWLGDGFASGGRTGYDHKKMGITARGAWEAVKRHFRELGTDIQTTPFTVAGVGDMSGDVFGNGMLLSRHIRLVAAFDHRDIFIDPNPDPEASFAERERLFRMDRSTWNDYNADLISKGGGVFSRQRKSIPLSPEIKALLDIDDDRLAPNDLMRAILQAKVDLLWFGGIGTYVKDTNETNTQANDRANDPIRINGKQVRARVIGEGANLGCTQRGRIEFARNGGHINTDSVDNAAGVDCSDHEVNIKIALDTVVRSGQLSETMRNVLLEEMTEEVASLVLRNNYQQTLALTMSETTARADIDAYGRFMRVLERQGDLNRDVEFLPGEEEMREIKEAGQSLTRPEIAVLMAYSKIALYNDLVASSLPDDSYLNGDLIRYFPKVLGERYRDALLGHRLRREIIATTLANDLVNTSGLTFVNRISESMGAEPVDIARAYIMSRDVFGLRDLRSRVNALDGQVPADVQTSLHLAIITFLRRQVLWFLRFGESQDDIAAAVEAYRPFVETLSRDVQSYLSAFDQQYMDHYLETTTRRGVDLQLAYDVAALEPLNSACDIIDIAKQWNWTPEETARAYFGLGAVLNLDRLRAIANDLTSSEHWERLAIKRTVEDLFRQQRTLTSAAISQCVRSGQALSGQDVVDIWVQQHHAAVDRAVTLMQEMESSGAWSGAKLSLASNQIRDLTASKAGLAQAVSLT